MRISKRTRYGVRLMIELAANYGKSPLSISHIAENEEISSKFLSQIIIPLKGAGFINATRGAQGGYELAKPPEEITLLEVFRVLESDCLLTECISDPGTCSRASSCVSRDIWGGLSQMIERHLHSMNFKELAGRAQRLSDKMSPVFYI